MKKTRKISAYILLILTLFASFSLCGCEKEIVLTPEQQELIQRVQPCASEYYKSFLQTPEEISLYEELKTAVLTYNKEYMVKHYDADTVNKVSLYLSLDCPFIVLSDNMLTYKMTHDYDSEIVDYFTEFNIPFSMDYENPHDEIMTSIDKAEEIIAAMPEYEDEYSIAKYMHDYLATHVAYSSDADTTNRHCTPYAALIEGCGKCESYSRAYALLCNLAGVECFQVMYEQSQTENNEGHMWNMVKINGNYYHVDVTHDSFSEDSGYPDNYIAYDYFMTDINSLANPGIVSDDIAELIPQVTSTEDMFFHKNGLVFDSYDRNTVGKAAGQFLKAQKENGLCGVSIKFTNESAYNKAIEKSEFQKLLYIISQNDGYGAKTYNYAENKKHLIIRIHPK